MSVFDGITDEPSKSKGWAKQHFGFWLDSRAYWYALTSDDVINDYNRPINMGEISKFLSSSEIALIEVVIDSNISNSGFWSRIHPAVAASPVIICWVLLLIACLGVLRLFDLLPDGWITNDYSSLVFLAFVSVPSFFFYKKLSEYRILQFFNVCKSIELTAEAFVQEAKKRSDYVKEMQEEISELRKRIRSLEIANNRR